LGIGVWSTDVKNRDGSSSNRKEYAITSDDQMPNGNNPIVRSPAREDKSMALM